jgi:Glycosyl transferase family 2
VTARVAVVLPVYAQAAFLGRAVGSLFAQTLPDWELVVVDDGSPEGIEAVTAPFGDDPRVRVLRHDRNQGLGAALNTGINATTAPAVAYLPADDRYDRDHLAALLGCLDLAVLAWSGVRHNGGGIAYDAPPGHPLQLVQVMHRRTTDRWPEREELESDDLELLFWSRLRTHGPTARTGQVTCEWVDHPGQRHKAIREAYDGGLNVFRRRYRIATPLRLHSSDSGLTDEVAVYARFRARPTSPAPLATDGLRILLVGELSYNPERILAFEERGHRLFGLWTPDGLGTHTVGPLPFGHVSDLPATGWHAAVRVLRPDVIYALLNWRAVPFAREVLAAELDVPFVWHFKEAPQRCLHRGTWPALVELCTRADALIVSTAEQRAWFELALPGRLDPARTLVLDGDLPKADWFTDERSARLSEQDGQLHTVVLGRPLGLDADTIVRLARAGVHTHLHGQVRDPGPTGGWRRWVERAAQQAPGYVHVHPRIPADAWVRTLSRYDAGWLHRFRSTNGGDLGRATWDDLNTPARIPPLTAAGLPMLHQTSPGSIVAAERLVQRTGAGLLYHAVDDLVDQLRDHQVRARAAAASWHLRNDMTFDAHVERLTALFRRISR